MSAADRRRAILDVVIPLLIEKGASVTTAEMARAAHIAEGTIFRVFPDKPTVIFEAVKAAMDPAPVAAAIGAIGRSAAVAGPARRGGARAARVFQPHGCARGARCVPLRLSHEAPGMQDVGRLIKGSSAVISAALAELFQSQRAALRVPPAKAAAAFRGLVFASGHPLLPPGERLPIDMP